MEEDWRGMKREKMRENVNVRRNTTDDIVDKAWRCALIMGFTPAQKKKKRI